MNRNEFGKQDFPKIGAAVNSTRNGSAAPKNRTWLYLVVIGALMGTLGIAMGSNRMYGSLTSFQAGNGEGIAGWILTVVGILLVLAGFAALMMRKEPAAPTSSPSHAGSAAAPVFAANYSTKGKLQELNSLLNEGLISQDEYDRKRRDLIERI